VEITAHFWDWGVRWRRSTSCEHRRAEGRLRATVPQLGVTSSRYV
jgi:hypothetical protein